MGTANGDFRPRKVIEGQVESDSITETDSTGRTRQLSARKDFTPKVAKSTKKSVTRPADASDSSEVPDHPAERPSQDGPASAAKVEAQANQRTGKTERPASPKSSPSRPSPPTSSSRE